MNAVDHEQHDGRRRVWTFGAIAVVLLAVLVARLCHYEARGERFEFEVPDDITFQYWARINSDDGSSWSMAPDVRSETGHAILDLLNGSERKVVQGKWAVRLDAWPPVYRSFVGAPSPPPPEATLGVLTADPAVGVIQIDFWSESSFTAESGWFDVPEENRRELRSLLDRLNAECETAYQQLGETRRGEVIDSSQEAADQDASLSQPDGR